MIAANFRKYPEAMALQLVLQFGHALLWALPRPTTRAGRAIRAARAAAFKLAGRIAYPAKRTNPAWARDAARRAKGLAKKVQRACRSLDFEQAEKRAGFRAHVAWCRETFDRYTFSIQ